MVRGEYGREVWGGGGDDKDGDGGNESMEGEIGVASFPGSPSFRASICMTFDPARKKSGGRAWEIFSRERGYVYVKCTQMYRSRTQ